MEGIANIIESATGEKTIKLSFDEPGVLKVIISEFDDTKVTLNQIEDAAQELDKFFGCNCWIEKGSARLSGKSLLICGCP